MKAACSSRASRSDRAGDWQIQLREAIGPGPVLGIDYHHRLSVAEAASFCQRMPSGTLDFIEEPIRDETPEAYESLRQMVDVSFAIGEEFASKWQFLPYLERGITNFARIDVSNVGGLTEAMKVASLAEAHYIDLMPHNPLGPICTAATVHLAAAVPNFSWMEIRESPTESTGFYNPVLFMARTPRVPTRGLETGAAWSRDVGCLKRRAQHVGVARWHASVPSPGSRLSVDS